MIGLIVRWCEMELQNKSNDQIACKRGQQMIGLDRSMVRNGASK
jgi:hypothetical protein